MKSYFKSYKDVKNVLEYLDRLGDCIDGETYMGKFIYSLAGYRKYADTECLNYFPFETLSQMLWGIMVCDEDCFII